MQQNIAVVSDNEAVDKTERDLQADQPRRLDRPEHPNQPQQVDNSKHPYELRNAGPSGRSNLHRLEATLGLHDQARQSVSSGHPDQLRQLEEDDEDDEEEARW